MSIPDKIIKTHYLFTGKEFIFIDRLVSWYVLGDKTYFLVKPKSDSTDITSFETHNLPFIISQTDKTEICRSLDNLGQKFESNDPYKQLIDTLVPFKQSDDFPRIGLYHLHTTEGSFPFQHIETLNHLNPSTPSNTANAYCINFVKKFPLISFKISHPFLTEKIASETIHRITPSEMLFAVRKLLESLVSLDEQLKNCTMIIRSHLILNYKQTTIEHLVKSVKFADKRDPIIEINILQKLIDDCLLSLVDHSSTEFWQNKLDQRVASLYIYEDLPSDVVTVTSLKRASPDQAQFDGVESIIKSEQISPPTSTKEPVDEEENNDDTMPPLLSGDEQEEEKESQAPPVIEKGEKPKETKESLFSKSFNGQYFVSRVGTAINFETYAEAVIAKVGDKSRCHFLLFNNNKYPTNDKTWLWVSIDGMNNQQHIDLYSKIQKRLPNFPLRTYNYEPHVSPSMMNGALSFSFNDVEIKKSLEFFIHGDSSAKWQKLHKKLIDTAGNCKTLLFQSRKKGWMPGRTMFVSVENLNYSLTIDTLFEKINVNDDFILLSNYTTEMIENIVPCISNDKELVERFTKPQEIKGDTVIVEAMLQGQANYVQLAKEIIKEVKDEKMCKFVLFRNTHNLSTKYSLAVTIHGMNSAKFFELRSLAFNDNFVIINTPKFSPEIIQSLRVPFVYDSDCKTTLYKLQKFYGCKDVKESLQQLEEVKQCFDLFGCYQFFGPIESPDLDVEFDDKLMTSNKSLGAKYADQVNQAHNYPLLILKTTEDHANVEKDVFMAQNMSTMMKICGESEKKINKMISSFVNK